MHCMSFLDARGWHSVEQQNQIKNRNFLCNRCVSEMRSKVNRKVKKKTPTQRISFGTIKGENRSLLIEMNGEKNNIRKRSRTSVCVCVYDWTWRRRNSVHLAYLFKILFCTFIYSFRFLKELRSLWFDQIFNRFVSGPT